MILFGMKSAFAIEVLPLKGGPRDGDRSAELSWCSWALWVDGKNLTAHTCLDNERVSPTINWPAIYLARWFVHAWSDLFERPRWPVATRARNARLVQRKLDKQLVQAIGSADEMELIEKRDRFCESHDLRSGAAGAAYPGVYLSRDGDTVTVCWHSPPNDRVVFHRPYGEADIDARSFAGSVEGFVDWIEEQLPADEPAPVATDKERFTRWMEFRNSEAAARAVMLGHAGIDEASLTQLITSTGCRDFNEFFGLAPGWDSHAGNTRPIQSPVAVAFRSTSPDVSAADLSQVRELVVSSKDNAGGRKALQDARRVLPEPLGGTQDYQQGYDLALAVRNWLRNSDKKLDVLEVVEKQLRIDVVDVELEAEDLEGGCVFGDSRGPAIFVNRSAKMSASPWGLRMTLAHELCHLLFDRPAEHPLAHISGIWSSPRLERRANAFAAELLLPQAGVLCVLGEVPVDPTDDDYQRLMSEFDVGFTTTSWHVANRFDLR